MNLKYKYKKEDFFFGINKSLLGNSWIKTSYDTRLSLNISQKYSFTNIMSNMLASRVKNIDDIKDFLRPELERYLPDPSIFIAGQ